LLDILAAPAQEEAAASSGPSPDKNLQFLDKMRILVILILCLKDLDELQKYIQIVDDTHKHPSQAQALEKVKIMFKKKVDIKNRQAGDQTNGAESQQTATTLGYAYSLGKGIASGLSSMLTDSNNFSNILARDIEQTLSHLRIRYASQSTSFIDSLTGEKTLLISHKDLKQVFAFAIGGGSFFKPLIFDFGDDPDAYKVIEKNMLLGDHLKASVETTNLTKNRLQAKGEG